MAEVIAVVAVVSSIVQLVDFTTKVLTRLNEIQSGTSDIPNSLRYLKTELPVLVHTLEGIHDAIKADRFPPKCATALQPAVDGCNQSIHEIESILSKSLPKQSDGKTKILMKSLGSVWNEGKIERITATLRGYIATLTFYFAASSSIQQPMMNEKLLAIQKWLSAPDPSENFFKGLRLREPNTGLWLLESDLYKSWKGKPSFVWLYGIPGCGKTVLSTTVLEDISKFTADDPGKATAYFYFDFNDRRKQDAEMMVRSLLSQLLQQSIEILPSVDALFKTNQRGSPLPPSESLLDALKELFIKFPATYIVLDALDECENRKELMNTIGIIATWNIEGLHVLFTSRRVGDITTTLEAILDSGNILNIQTKAVDRDIQLYVHQRIAEETSLQKWKDDDKQLMERSLTDGACGMFRLAACRLDILRKCRNRKQLLQAIANLPPDLDEMYNRILDQIEDDDVPYAIRILRWLAFASRPLSLREVAEIAALDSNRCPAFDPDEVLQDPSDVLTICSSLVTITDEDKLYPKVTITTLYSPKVYTKPVVILAHYSVKEYLVSDRILKSKARLYGVDPIICHQTLAKNCVQYLLRLEEHLPQLDELYDETFSPDEVLSDFALAKYSALQWKHHYDLVAKPKPELKELVVELFKSEKILTCTNRFKGFREFYNRDRYLTKLMYNACVSGQRLVSDTDVDINESNLACWTALDTASEKGYLDIVQFLLEKGATVTKQCLWLASYKGHLDIVKLLLEKDTEGKDVALSVASGQGNLEVVRLLVKHGASVNTEDKQGQRPLQSASSEGHLEVVQFLLENGARITEGCLWLASYKGHLDIVKLLLEKDTEGKVAALSVASGQGNLELVKFLVKHGAQVNTKRRRQRSLQSASAEDYGIFSGLVSNALFSALLGGHFHVARFLVEKEADVNAWGKERYGTASIAASAQERFDIVRYFVDQGATNREESR